MDAGATYSVAPHHRKMGDSGVPQSAFSDKLVSFGKQTAHCMASSQICLNHFHIFYQAICKTLHCCIIAVGFGMSVHHESLGAHHSPS